MEGSCLGRALCELKLAAGLAALALMLVPTIALAEPAGVSFLSPTPYAIEVAASDESGSLSVVVFNGSLGDQTITLRIFRLVAAGGITFPPSGLSISPAQLVRGGDVSREFTIAATRGETSPGSYAGNLIATSTDGTMAQAGLTVTPISPVGGSPAESPTADALRVPLPDKVPQSGTNFLPSPFTRFLAWLGGIKGPIPCVSCFVVDEALPPVRVPVTPELSTSASSAIVVASDGSRAVAQPSGLMIEVDGFTGSGQYDGKLAFGDEASTTLTISVSDLFVWPLLILLAGLLVAGWVDRRLSRQIPRTRLRLALQTLKDQAVAEQMAAAAEQPRAADPIYEIWTDDKTHWVDEGQGALAVEARKALLEFDETADAAKAAGDWAQSGTKFGAVKTITVDFQKLLREADVLRAAYSALERLVGNRWEEVRRQPVADNASAVLVGRLLGDAVDLKVAATSMNDATALMSAFARAYEVIAKWHRDQDDETKKEELVRLLAVLCTGELTTAAEVNAQVEEARANAPADGEVSVVRRVDVRELDFMKMVDEVAGPRPPIVVADLTKALDRQEIFAKWVGAILVVLTGLSALYYTNPTFGSLPDYLGVFLWGGVVGTGVTIARRLGPLSAETVRS